MRKLELVFAFLKRLYSYAELYYPLSFAGSLCLGFSLYLAGYAVSNSNIYALLLALPALVCIPCQVLFIRLWLLRRRLIELQQIDERKLQARDPASLIKFKLDAPAPPYFFRYHSYLRAKLQAGKQAHFYYYKERSASLGGALEFHFYFPLCGALELKSRLLLRDLLGMSRTRIGGVQKRQKSVRPAALASLPPLPRHYSATLESQQNKVQSDEEKYYMREYIAGDRLKDINWKASLRVGEMITRIAPQSYEQSYLIQVELRTYSVCKKDNLSSLALLNVLKSCFLSFLLCMRHSKPNYQFQVTSSAGESLLCTEKDIDNFAAIVAELPCQYSSSAAYSLPSDNEKGSRTKKERFVFTTSLDPALAQIKKQEEAHLFEVTQAKPFFRLGKKEKKERQLFRLLPLKYHVPWPGLRSYPKLLRAKRRKQALRAKRHYQIAVREKLF